MLETIGNTPLVRVGRIYAKLETTNPTGSIKDRLALYLIKKADERGELRKGYTIVELTSGNTGISLAMISAVKCYRFIAIIPEFITIEKRKMIEKYGAEIILTPAKMNMDGAVKIYEKFVNNKKNIWLPRQFENHENIDTHRFGTGREIIQQMNSKIDAFVAGVGTGGTLIGVGLALKEINPKVKIIAVEPDESAVLSGDKPGSHKIHGIGEGFIPKIVQDNMNIINKIIRIKSDDAIAMSKNLAKKHDLFVGISSGANILAARQIAKKYKRVVTVLPDSGDRYVSIF